MGLNLSNEANLDYLKEDISTEEEIEDNLENSKAQNCGIPENCYDSAADTMDAVPPSATMTITISPEQVLLIERALETYEKVSLLFLLVDDPHIALAQISKLLDSYDDRFIYKWTQAQTISSKWQEKLVEAICIIQNYEVLRLLNYQKKDLIIRFLPRRSFTSLYVNLIRKALYLVCESLIRKEVENMLGLLRSDFSKKKLKFKDFGLRYLEPYFLHCESVGYIKPNDLTCICNILKQIGQLDLAESLKTLMPKTKNVPNFELLDSKKPENVFEHILDPCSSLSKLTSFENNTSDNSGAKIFEKKYHLDPNNPGVCLVINQETFYREVDPKLQHLLPSVETKLESRTGTEHDKAQIVETFELFGFKIITVDNLIHSEIVQKIAQVMKSITNESSFFVCILSHGDKGVIYGVNSCRVDVDAIKRVLVTKNRDNLAGKPKVLILQSCQGTNCQKVSLSDDNDITTDGPRSTSKEEIPPYVDLFTFWATVPGYGAIRNKRTGSWFIQSLCDQMKTLANTHHFEDICTNVVDDVSSRRWTHGRVSRAMVPLKESSFSRKLYLPPLRL